MIHVCYAYTDRDGNYSKFVGTSVKSVFANTNEDITIHIIHDSNLTETNRKYFDQLPIKENQSIKFYNVEKYQPEIITFLESNLSQMRKNRWSIGSLYRLMSIDMLPTELDRLIYLDADIIVNLDLKEL